MSQTVHIEHIGDTEANVRANMDLLQIAILTDQNEEFVWYNDDASKLYYAAAQKYWTGAAFVYCDASFKDVTATEDVSVGEYIYHYGDTDTYAKWSDDGVTFSAGGVLLLTMAEDTQDTVIFNESNGDVDWTVHSAATNNVIFIRGSDGVVDIGGAVAPTWKTATYDVLAIGDNTAWAVLPDAGGYGHTAELVANAYYDITDSRWEYGDAGAYASRYSIEGCDSTQYHTWYMSTLGASAGDAITWIEVMQIEGNGSAGTLHVNGDSADFDVQVETNGDTHMLFSDGGNNKLCVSTDTALAAKLTILQDDASGESCLSLSQADVSEGVIDFVASDRGPQAWGASTAAAVRVELNGTVYLIPLLADA